MALRDGAIVPEATWGSRCGILGEEGRTRPMTAEAITPTSRPRPLAQRSKPGRRIPPIGAKFGTCGGDRAP